MLQLDHDERVRARRSGERPKFQIIGLEALIAIDAMQSLNGLARPFSMWADLRAIESGVRREAAVGITDNGALAAEWVDRHPVLLALRPAKKVAGGIAGQVGHGADTDAGTPLPVRR